MKTYHYIVMAIGIVLLLIGAFGGYPFWLGFGIGWIITETLLDLFRQPD
jgi:hypothetical protein